MLENIKLPRLDAMTALVSDNGASTITFSQWWDKVATQIETAINGINDALNAAAVAQASADTAQGTADGAQTSADSATALAATKVPMDAGPTFGAVSGTISRAAYTTYGGGVAAGAYSAVQMQAVMDALVAVSQVVGAAVTDLRANHSLKP